MAAYEGKEPYIFISYSHKNSDQVHRAIEEMQKAGYRVWFDGGIEAGSEWPEYIASHLKGCTCVISFISEHFVLSPNCRRELNYALKYDKPMLNVHIDEVELPDGLDMQLALNQALHRSRFSEEAEFHRALCEAAMLQSCRQPEERSAPPVNEAEPEKEPEPEKEVVPTEEPNRKDTGKMTAKGKVLAWLAVLLELAYGVFIGPKALHFLTSPEIYAGGGGLFARMLLPHVAVAAVFLVLYLILDRSGTASVLAMFAMVGAVLIATFMGAVQIQLEIGLFLRILLSLGLNIVPALLAAGVYFGCTAAAKTE
ncbi:MAG: toll/interleukin-1 receptor domain-containing protein [Clostridia bacterium]|nr:toll/interleukin-1 receptor domain-containing protein [Clostridia bacterium]